MKALKLNENVNIPILGFGTWKLTGREGQKAIDYALKAGYRHLDTAQAYQNHKDIAQVINQSNIKREDIFITSKIRESHLKKEDVLVTLKQMLNDLDTDYIDLLLIHWPNFSVPIEETLEEFEKAQSQKLIRSYGVSNFSISLLKEALDKGFHPTNNQVEFHPQLNQKKLKDFCDQNNITLTAYSPLDRGGALTLKLIQELSEKYNRSSSQIILAWLRQKNIIAIPKASEKDHIDDNFQSLSLKLENEDLNKIDSINQVA